MSATDRQRKIEEVFLAVADAPMERRDAMIDELAAGDAALAGEVRSLLGHHKDDGVLEPSREHRRAMMRAVAQAEPELTMGAPIAPGGRIGHYEIKGVLGSGGMGVVYIAEQDRPRRIVALKVIRRGLASRRMLRRFEAEAEMLGRLQHTGIAQIFEAGTWDDGGGPQPYIAMELVDGPALTRWVENKRLGTRESLALMAKVCDAVHHAHQRGVLHRDLKPGNILVQDGPDGIGQPKVLDFGIARPLGDADPAATTLKTDIGQLVGTLAYMSPEQIGGSAEEVDVRSDVYALGVIMYRLLAGRLPLDLGDRSIPEAARIIMEQAPAPLSQVSKIFRGDVETIVFKAMEKDKTRRYQSAADLAEDLRRYLAGMPISAKRDSALYVLGKQLRRYRGVAIASAAAAIALLGLGAYSAWQWRVNTILAEQQMLLAKSADSARASAEREREEATRLRVLADSRAEDMRRQLYSSSIGFAQAALQGDYVRRARELLTHCPTDLRGWEWDYLSRLSDTSLASRIIEKPDVSLFFCGDVVGGRFGIRGEGQSLQIFDESTFWSGAKPLLVVPESYAINARLSLGGKAIAFSSADHVVRSVSVESGKEMFKLRPFAGRANLQCVSADGDRLLIAEVNMGRSDVMWASASDGSTLLTGEITHDGDVITQFAVSPDGKLLAYVTHNGKVGFLDAQTFAPIDDRFIQADRSIHKLVFSPDGKYIAMASAMVSLQIADVEQRRRVALITGTQSAFNQIVFSPDGTQIAGAHDDGVVKIYESASGRVLSSLRGHTSAVFGIAYASDGKSLLTGGGDGTIRKWDPSPEPDNPVVSMGTWPQCLGLSPDGNVLAVGLVSGTLRLCDPASGKTIRDIALSLRQRASGIWGVTFTRDSRKIIATCADGSIHIADVASGAIERTILSAHTGRALNARACIGDRLLLSVGEDGLIRAWSLATGRSEGNWPAHPGAAFVLNLSPDGNRAFTSGGDGIVREWDLTQTLADFNAPGRGLETAITAPKQVREYKHSSAEMFSMCLSPDGTRLASGDSAGLLKLWDTRTGVLLREAKGHDGAIHRIVFSPDGRRIFTGGWDSVARVWVADTLEQLLLLRGHQYMLYHIELTQDGRTLITSSQDRKLRFWYSRASDMPGRITNTPAAANPSVDATAPKP
ncbi:MAG: WD40 repeat domain-containing serine/threonine protein kinase [Planctomycetota bacterium]|nr:WD40 repeat domain-containing serine/threonine protein kinase [Planctomycetota bacterium]